MVSTTGVAYGVSEKGDAMGDGVFVLPPVMPAGDPDGESVIVGPNVDETDALERNVVGWTSPTGQTVV